MKLFTVQFLADLVDLKHSREPEKVIDLHKQSSARQLGEMIASEFKFDVSEYPNKESIPEIAFTRDHEFKDCYKLQAVVMTREELNELVDSINEIRLIYGGRNASHQFDRISKILNH